MGSSPGFGSTPCDSIALFGLAFAAAPRRRDLLASPHRSNSSAHSSIGTPSSLRRRTPTACRPTVSGLFHSPSGVLFTFPSRYLCTIGRQGYLALEGGPPSFPRDSTCPAVLTNVSRVRPLSPTGLSPALAVLSRFLRLEVGFVTLRSRWGFCCHAVQPPRGIGPQATKPRRFRLFPFRSPLLRESRLLSFPQGNEMFQFPWLPPQAYVFGLGCTGFSGAGSPIRVSPAKPAWRLTEAYRSRATPFIGP